MAVVLGALLAGNPPGFGAVPATPAALRVSLSGDDAACSRSSTAVACATFNRAYALASGGDVIEVAAGAYPGQSIGSAGSKSGPITFRPAPLAAVTVEHLSISASHVHVQNIIATGSGEERGGLDVCERECVPDVVDVVVQNFRGKSAFIRASNVTIKGGEFGGFDACLDGNPEDAFRLWGGSVVPQPVNDVVEGVTIHDVASGVDNTCQGTSQAGIHVDCAQTQGGISITFRGNVFYNCPTANIQAQPFGGATEANWLIEDNFFGPTACCNSVALEQAAQGGDCSSFVVRYNVMSGPVNDFSCGGAPLQLYGNVFTRNVSSCAANSDEAYNVYPAGNTATCRGVGNRKCNPAFVAGSAVPPNYRLLDTDRCARGAGDPKRFPHTDIAGRLRPQGVLPDAGAFEIPVIAKPKPKPKPKRKSKTCRTKPCKPRG